MHDFYPVPNRDSLHCLITQNLIPNAAYLAQAERNPDGISHCEAVQLSILAQEKFRQQSVQNAKLVKKVQSMLKDVARSKKLKKDHQKLAEAHEAAQKYILRLQKTVRFCQAFQCLSFINYALFDECMALFLVGKSCQGA